LALSSYYASIDMISAVVMFMGSLWMNAMSLL
jgi:hypothetical protein